MAATLQDILSIIARDKDREKAKPSRHTKAGTKIAMDILHHFKFPGDDDTKPEDTDK